MSKDKANTSRVSFKDIQVQIEDFKHKRDDLNKKTKEYINDLQEIENEIVNDLKSAKEVYKKKRDYWNSKVKKLKEKKLEYKKLMDDLLEEKKKYQKPKDDNYVTNYYTSIKQIEKKIDSFERRIETEKLDIPEENSIIDQIKELATKKQEFLKEQQNENLFKIERKIEIVKINLSRIYEQLSKLSNKSQEYHSKMIELFKKVDELKDTKMKKEEKLIENKKTADQYHEQFLNLMAQLKKSNKRKGGRRPYGSQSKSPKSIRRKQPSKQSEMLEKLKQDKLVAALEKQKAGKRLNLFEARLIFEQK